MPSTDSTSSCPAGDAKFGNIDYALDSNSMYELVDLMDDIPIKTDADGRTVFLKDVAKPKDAASIQTNVVRVDGRRQVYIPVYRQSGVQHAQRRRQPEGQPAGHEGRG